MQLAQLLHIFYLSNILKLVLIKIRYRLSDLSAFAVTAIGTEYVLIAHKSSAIGADDLTANYSVLVKQTVQYFFLLCNSLAKLVYLRLSIWRQKRQL